MQDFQNDQAQLMYWGRKQNYLPRISQEPKI